MISTGIEHLFYSGASDSMLKAKQPKVTKPKATKEKLKPCGYDGYCPLIDERRLFYEAQVILEEMRVPVGARYQLVYTTINKWCHRHHALDLEPELPRCRQAMAEAATSYQQSSPDKRLAYYITTLYRLLGAVETEDSQVQDLLKKLIQQDMAPF
jgi:hypothetical protein